MSRCHPIQRGDRTSRSTASDYADQTGSRYRPQPVRTWLIPTPPAGRADPHPRAQAVITELLIVLTVTLGLSAIRSLLSLIDALPSPGR